MSTGIRKQLNGALLGGLFATLICANGIVGAATAEIESNDTQARAQMLVITDTGASVSPAATGSTDIDIYAFDAKAGDIPVIMVITDAKWNSVVALYDSLGILLDTNDDAVTMNPGSVTTDDSRIDSHLIDADGRYYVAVSPMPRFLGNYYEVQVPVPTIGGAYTLLVQGVTPPGAEPPPSSGGADPRVVTLLVMNWRNDEPGLGKYKGKDPIPVAIMSTPDFDATTMIDRESLTFGATGTEKSLVRCKKKGKDVKIDKVKDGMRDLVCYFRPDVAGFTVGDVQAFLQGNLVDGGTIEASAALRTLELPKGKIKGWHERHNVDPRAKTYRPR
jgi:hypothetical protein